MKRILNEINRLAEKKTGTNPQKRDMSDVINYMSENMTGINPKEKTVAKALKYYTDNYVGGGGITPTGTINIIENGTVDVTNYASANVNVPGVSEYFSDTYMAGDTTSSGINKMIKKVPEFTLPANVNNIEYIFTKCNSLLEAPALDLSNIVRAGNMFSNCSSLTTVPNYNAPNLLRCEAMFAECSSLVTAPELGALGILNTAQMFENCTSLRNVPLYTLGNNANVAAMFNGCHNLTDESLDNILKMCAAAPDYRKTKTWLFVFGNDNYYPVSRIEALPSYQEFLDAGWTIGY